MGYLSMLLTAIVVFKGTSKAIGLLHGHISAREAYPAGAILLAVTFIGLMYEVVVRPLLRAQEDAEREASQSNGNGLDSKGDRGADDKNPRHGPRRLALASFALCLLASVSLLMLPMEGELKNPHGPSASGKHPQHGSGQAGEPGSHRTQSHGSRGGGRTLVRSETGNNGATEGTGAEEPSRGEAPPSASTSGAGTCTCSSPSPAPAPEPCGCSSPCTCSAPPAVHVPPSGGSAGESEPEPEYGPEPEYEEPEYEEEI